MPEVREHREDSYVVDITPPGSTFPYILITRRSRTRVRGKITSEEPVESLGSQNAYDEEHIEETALRIIDGGIAKPDQYNRFPGLQKVRRIRQGVR